ncbi:enoyl-CoA hydratase/isomerase family protein [Nocardioides sp. WS12]|uniref:enoyl-CoA hydratase/isomerase family protein n=1 Tax=Nocardioides sp. WS12 TaxID=2486272 RepID=UPI0015FCDDB3|nr:enoyl-CoA hydratase/isomerase family protein [Nocardioides sp. WS12]
MGSYEQVVLTRRDAVVEVRLHSDGGELLWTPTVHRELPIAFAEVGADITVKTVIVTGTGSSFCAGVDMAAFKARSAGGGGWDPTWYEGKRLLQDLVGIDVPVIGVVNGPALIHSEIPLLADVVIAADHAVFQDSGHFQTGGVPGDGVNLVWSHLIGTTRANYFLMTGQVLTAADALALGAVNEVLPLDQVSERAWELAACFAQRPLPVLRYTREALNLGRRRMLLNDLSHGLAVEGLGLAAARSAREA